MSTIDDTSTALPDFDSQWDYNDPAGSEAAFAALLPRTQAAGDADYHAQLLTQIARAQGLQRKFDETNATLDKVEPMLGDDTPVANVRYLLERGRVLNSSGKRDASVTWFERAWDASKEEAALEFYAVDAAHMLGIVSPADEALRWNEIAIAAAERAADPRARRWLGPLYNNTGWTYHDKGEYERALSLFEKARDWNEEHGNTQTIRIARWTVARCYRSLKRYDEALVIQRELEKQWEADGQPDGYVFEEIAELLLANGDEEAARPYFGKAHEVLSKDAWLQANEGERLERLKALSE